MRRLLIIALLIVGCWMDADLNELNNAAYHGDINAVTRLINIGKDTNGTGWDGDTPLAHAIYETNIDILNLLCKYGDEYACKETNPL